MLLERLALTSKSVAATAARREEVVLLAARLEAVVPPDASHGFVMLGKTFKGMTDDMLAWQTQALLALETQRDAYMVYVRHELVVEVAFDGVQASPQYPGGVALRFARVKSYRSDKSARDADTLESVLARAAR